MATLLDTIRARNPSCKLVVSGIIIRPQDEITDVKFTRPGNRFLILKRRFTNSVMEPMVEARGGTFLWTWLTLMTGSVAATGLYSEDGLHLNLKGIQKITKYLSKNLDRALSDAHNLMPQQ
jgi:hypothetical protein